MNNPKVATMHLPTCVADGLPEKSGVQHEVLTICTSLPISNSLQKRKCRCNLTVSSCAPNNINDWICEAIAKSRGIDKDVRQEYVQMNSTEEHTAMRSDAQAIESWWNIPYDNEVNGTVFAANGKPVAVDVCPACAGKHRNC